MQIINTSTSYGWLAIIVHWVAAVAVFGMFALGFWMVDLTYYSEWYQRAPDIHRSIGVLLFVLTVFRLLWRLLTASPAPLAGHKRWEVASAYAAHGLLYVLVFVATVSGFLISTADGSSVSVFGWFDVPSVTGQVKRLEDTAGLVHYWSTWALVALALIHSAGALKHHFIDRDNTLRQMLVPQRQDN
ncbi:cytochrome b561 [Marinobacter sp. LV10R510-11A]|uniref:cytochrome b n=1 Tax=Marinobacter sp. LV10R510-11A TaxID=1415568 RepID=UPI000BB87EA4|nr:cytochrome b [Marinobacter sp. LV10R510-11A]SOB78350.1 cytochrome b561 [Marinobacter sp. LV10R510-11A]